MCIFSTEDRIQIRMDRSLNCCCCCRFHRRCRCCCRRCCRCCWWYCCCCCWCCCRRHPHQYVGIEVENVGEQIEIAVYCIYLTSIVVVGFLHWLFYLVSPMFLYCCFPYLCWQVHLPHRSTCDWSGLWRDWRILGEFPVFRDIIDVHLQQDRSLTLVAIPHWSFVFFFHTIENPSKRFYYRC